MAASDKVFKMPIPADEMTASRLRVFYRDYPFGQMEVECTKDQLDAANNLPGKVLFHQFNPEYQAKYPNAYCAWERIVFLKERDVAASDEKMVWAHSCGEREGDVYHTFLDSCPICGKRRPEKEGGVSNEVNAIWEAGKNLPPPPALKGYKFIASDKQIGKIVGILTHQNTVIVATETGVYRLEDDVLKPLKFEVAP